MLVVPNPSAALIALELHILTIETLYLVPLDDDAQAGSFRVHRGAFVDEGVFQRERSEIFDRCWLYAMHESELQNVLKTLGKAGISVVAIHQHMVGEQPRIMFLHYWGVASTKDLAKGLRAALDVTRD